MRLLPFVFILAAIGLFFAYISPAYSGVIATTNANIATDKSALDAAAAFTKKENELIAQRDALDPTNVQRLMSFMPDGVNNIQLIVDLNALAARSGVTLSAFDIAAPTNTSAAAAAGDSSLPSTKLTNSLNASVSATGTYGNFESFLIATEQSLRPMDITHLSITPASTGLYTYSVTFRIYWLN